MSAKLANKGFDMKAKTTDSKPIRLYLVAKNEEFHQLILVALPPLSLAHYSIM
jgi:hypothetical protein